MKNIKAHFKFNKQERSGVFFLLLIILVLQIGYIIFRSFSKNDATGSFVADLEMQAKVDMLKQAALQKDSVKIYPFNPNFMTDYKGYELGMSVQEIDRLHHFRSDSKYVNTAEDFQKVTQVSDSLLQLIVPYFKFPEWIKTKKQGKQKESKSNNARVQDINLATVTALRAVNGIGEKLSARIVKFRDRLGGFLVNEQLFDVYGLEPDVAERVLKKFKVLEAPSVKKIDVNTASLEELQQLVYIKRKIAFRIVNYRKEKGSIISFDELKEIEDFPADKIDRITLYLSL